MDLWKSEKEDDEEEEECVNLFSVLNKQGKMGLTEVD